MLDKGACGSSHYDPDEVYVVPSLEATLDFDGDRLIFDGAVPASYGMDFLKVRLDPGMRGQSSRLEAGCVQRRSPARFGLQTGRFDKKVCPVQRRTALGTTLGVHALVSRNRPDLDIERLNA